MTGLSSPPPVSPPARLVHPVAVAVAIAVAALAFLPIANWIAGGHHAPWYAAVASTWVTGSLIAIGLGVVLAMISRRIPILWQDGLGGGIAEWVSRSPRMELALLVVSSTALYAMLAHVVFDARPLLVDEIFQVWQARVFAEGRLTSALPAHPEFFSGMHLVETERGVFSHFPPGHSLLLMIGELVRAPWLIVPLAAALAAAAFARYLRVAEPHATVRLAAVLFLAFAPFIAFMSATYMNHMTSLMWLMIAIAALARAVEDTGSHTRAALVCGLALGAAGTIRPIDAVAFALPAAAWLLVRALRQPARWREAIAAAIGVAIPLAALMWFNARTTGHPLMLGYELLWGREHGLGFRSTPWGAFHTPARGLELINLYFLRLQTFLYEWPIPSLVPVIGGLALAPRLDRYDRYLLGSAGLLVIMHFAFWHDGFYLGPRYMIPLVPVLALWTARLPALLHERFGEGMLLRTSVYALVTAAVISSLSLVPSRARQYAAGLTTMRWDADAAAREAGAQGSLVFVRESWGSQLMARLWALGLTRAQAERVYAKTDACLLERGLERLEQNGVRGAEAAAAFEPLMRDSLRLVASSLSPDASVRVLPGSRYTAKCLARLNEDREGFTLYTPLILAGRKDGTVYARDLHERNALLIAKYPDRPVFLLRPSDSLTGSTPAFLRQEVAGKNVSKEGTGTRD